MPHPRRMGSKMTESRDFSSIGDEVSVVDVYDIASDIGKECELIIDKWGAEAVTALLPRVITALELLESLAIRNEKENHMLRDLSAKIERLESDKIERAEYRERFEKEIEAIEEQWRLESAELVAAVSRLQDENRKLRRSLHDRDQPPPGAAVLGGGEGACEEGEGGGGEGVVARLSAAAARSRHQLRAQDHDLAAKQLLIDNLTGQVDRLTALSTELRNKQKILQAQIRSMCEERGELTGVVHAQQRELAALHAHAKRHQRCEQCGGEGGGVGGGGGEGGTERVWVSARELRDLVCERDRLRDQLATSLAHDSSESSEWGGEAEAEGARQQGDGAGQEAGQAQAQGQAQGAGAQEEGAVEGPLPREPDDAPWKRQNSGIRKLQWLAWRARRGLQEAQAQRAHVAFGPWH